MRSGPSHAEWSFAIAYFSTVVRNSGPERLVGLPRRRRSYKMPFADLPPTSLSTTNYINHDNLRIGKTGKMVLFLDKLLSWQPWASDQNRREFVSAIPERIPFPSESLTWATWAYCLGAPAPEGFTFEIESAHQVASMPPPPLHSTKEWFREMKIIWGPCDTDDSPAY